MDSLLNSTRERLAGRLALFSAWTVSIVLDSTFLVVWLATQWAVERSARLLASSLDHIIINAFEVTFAISTLFLVILYDYMDIRIMVLQMQHEIENQKRETASASGKAIS